MKVPAVVAAGDGRAAKAVHGESKPYVDLAGRTLVEHVVDVLQAVPEVSEVWVVGDAERLDATLRRLSDAGCLTKPLHVVEQFRNLYENAWETYRRLLPGAGPDGREPTAADADHPVLFLSADIPFATPHEISDFVRRGLALECDYAVGLCTEEAMVDFYPAGDQPGIRMAYFNLREGRFRQSNLHLVKPVRMGNRTYIEQMYEHRYQRQIGQILLLAWELFWAKGGGPSVLYYYALLQISSIVDRHGMRGIADWLRSHIPMPRIERGISAMLDTEFRFAVTEVGGCAVDIDNEADCDAARVRFDEWKREQAERAEARLGPLLPSRAQGEPSQ